LRASRAVRVIPLLAATGAVTIVTAGAAGQLGALNDLFAVGQGSGDSPARAPVVHRAEPPSVATPLVPCAPGSRQQPDVDGRVPAGSAKDGLSCNVTPIGHQGTEGGFKVFRYFDVQGHECAFYDTTLMFPLNALNPGGGSAGVAVLDMSDPSHPVQTDTLTTPPMLSPHESVNLNPRRGLLAAVNGNLTTEPGLVAIYDAHTDCRHPVLRSLSPVARFGHESGFSSDGKTFYATSTALQAITAIDVTDPDHPHAIWEGNIFSHGMSLSPDGNRAYIADPGTAPGGDSKANMLILDTSEIQARKSDPHAREISRLTWNSASIPQNAIPFTRDGRPYVLEFDEYTQATLHPDGDPDVVGAARIIDISDETKPFVVSNLRLAINQPAEHRAATEADDPGTGNPAQGYAAHYCNIPTRVDPKIVACSFIASGLRVFDITDLARPKEIGYFVAPPQPRSENGYMASDFAMSQPAFAPERREIWFSDGTSGFYALRVDKSVWPADAPRAPARRCQARRRLLVKVRVPRGARVSRVRATLAGRRVRTVRRRGGLYAVVDLRRVSRRTARLVIRLRLVGGRRTTTSRVYRLCPRARR
jgi:hypothetical protein